ncbi:post-GPI attachment to proteins factor 4-like [Ostrea edulis]|uniref:post-GPI attachment to proteins factor 4-like n=1 Tax=Ostrea edulis TaxID=37623 RepID=UPI0024AF4295|nr:post-GPI attachment to proteins factor 4-like [Ostrea edulis]XP_056006462.1 post-GPI attachment to proteins factor 4-like [Ostrea edulis]
MVQIFFRFWKHLGLLALVTFFIALPLLSLKHRYTVYDRLWHKEKSHTQELMRNVNNQRISEAKNFITQYEISRGELSIQKPVDVGITVITVSRNRHKLDQYEPKYLTQVVSKSLQLIQAAEHSKLSYRLFICNVDDEPFSYFELEPLTKLVTTFSRFPNSSSRPLFERSVDQTLEKEKQDYVYCGEETLKRNVSNVLLMEDDALPNDDMVSVVDHHLYSLGLGERKPHQSNITFIKLYHPDRLLGFISLEKERLPELFCLGLILTTFFVKAYLTIRPIDAKHRKIIWLGFFVYSCLFVLAVGRQNFSAIRRISKYLYQVTPAPSCCTPAIVYTRSGFNTVSSYLKSVTCKSGFGKDTAIDKLRKQSPSLRALLIQPNLFTHIGMYSSLRDQVLDPFIV